MNRLLLKLVVSMVNKPIPGITLEPLKVIFVDNGCVRHGLKSSDDSFVKFGEAYFSEVKYQKIKGWKLHKEMILNLVVPVGNIRFVFFCEASKEFYDVTIGENNYQRLTVKPGIWFAFQGVGKERNVVLNIASINHNPEEVNTCLIDSIPYDW